MWELLTRTSYEDGSVRMPADLSIQAGIGCWMVTLRCHSEALSVTASVPTLAEVATTLESLLMSPSVPWRPYETWRGREQSSTKPKKK